MSKFEKAFKQMIEIEEQEELLDNPEFLKKIKKPWDEMRPVFKDFVNKPYKFEKIEADQEKLREREAQLHSAGEVGKLGEYVVMQGIHDEAWLPCKDITPTNRFDDVFYGTDFVIIFENDSGKNLYLNVDVTTTQSKIKIDEKLNSTENFMQKGKLGKLEYFKDEDGELEGGSVEFPKILVIIDPAFAINMQKIMIKSPSERSAVDQELLDIIKMLIRADFIYQLANHIKNLGKLIDKSRLSRNKEEAQKYKSFSKQYEEILTYLLSEIDLQELINYIKQLAKKAEELGNIAKSKLDRYENFLRILAEIKK